ncbi:hypothetical protein RclHR1_15640009 [Rhizophagus clarus]|uniref:RRM domain-containing protein n=1 Tax=Rhizophagus clarus TaxID=94130 RepID=A0A2Z6QWB1_9GLOM|nr:hypothetical protein RclHR1_15640009 [Rhizophagus clarus]
MSYFKKFGNIASCRVYFRKNAKVQQARIVYDSALSIARFDTQWAIYCFSTCLRVTPCHYTVDQKSSCYEFVATLTQLPPNTKDIDLAPLIRDLGDKAVNVPLSLNSYKPKRWAYITFNSQETMDAAMEQIIGFRDYTLQWNLPDNTNKLCHRCVAALKERFNINQPARLKERSRSGSHSCLRSKDPGNFQSSQPQKPLANTRILNSPYRDRSKSNDKCDHLVSFSMVLRTSPSLSSPNQAITMSSHEAANILSLLKSLQQDMAEVCDRITALELNDRRMTRIEQHLGLLPSPDIPATNQSSDMLIDAPVISNSTVTPVSSRPTASPVQTPLNPLSPGFTPSRPVRATLSAPIDLPEISSPSSTSQAVPSPTQTRDKIQAINAKHSAIKNKLDMLANSISGFIGSITSSSSSSNSASMADNNFNYDSFVRNPLNPLNIDNLSLQDSLFSFTSPTPFPRNSFNISLFNINGLKMFSHNKIELLNDFFSLKHISFGGVVDTHLHSKQMHFLSKQLSNYTVFSSALDTSQHVRSSGGVSLFIENSLAPHVHTYSSLSSRLLSVDLYFKGHVKLRIFVVYIPPTSDQSLRDKTIDLLISALSEAK